MTRAGKLGMTAHVPREIESKLKDKGTQQI